MNGCAGVMGHCRRSAATSMMHVRTAARSAATPALGTDACLTARLLLLLLLSAGSRVDRCCANSLTVGWSNVMVAGTEIENAAAIAPRSSTAPSESSPCSMRGLSTSTSAPVALLASSAAIQQTSASIIFLSLSLSHQCYQEERGGINHSRLVGKLAHLSMITIMLLA